MLLNDDFLQDQSAAFAERVAEEAGARPRPADRARLRAGAGPSPHRPRAQVAARLPRPPGRAVRGDRSRASPSGPRCPGRWPAATSTSSRPEDFLSGPRTGWAYGRGRWGKPYEGILVLLDPRADSPFALDGDVPLRRRHAPGPDDAQGRRRAGRPDRPRQRRRRTDAHSGYDFALRPQGADRSRSSATAKARATSPPWRPPTPTSPPAGGTTCRSKRPARGCGSGSTAPPSRSSTPPTRSR